jgi:DNA polymerase-1
LEKKENQKSMRDVDEEIKEYAAEDADITFQLKEISLELEKTEPKTFEIEIPLVKVLADMEKKASVDVDFLKSISKELDNDIKSLEKIL